MITAAFYVEIDGPIQLYAAPLHFGSLLSVWSSWSLAVLFVRDNRAGELFLAKSVCCGKVNLQLAGWKALSYLFPCFIAVYRPLLTRGGFSPPPTC